MTTGISSTALTTLHCAIVGTVFSAVAGAQSPGDGRGPTIPGPGTVTGLVATTHDDPEWVIAVSDLILRETLCTASFPCAPDQWYEQTAGAPCYNATRYWKFAPDVEEAEVFPLSAIGGPSIDGVYARGGVLFRIYDGIGTGNPVGPQFGAGQYLSVDVWQPLACDGFEANTFFVNGGPGELSAHSMTLTRVKSIPIEGGVRVGSPLAIGSAKPQPMVEVNGVPATDVAVYGTEAFGFEVFYTMPPLAPAVADVEVFDGQSFVFLERVDYTDDVPRGIGGARTGAEEGLRELLTWRPDDFEHRAPEVGAATEVLLHRVLQRAESATANPLERTRIAERLEGFLPPLRDLIQAHVQTDGSALPNFPAPILRPPTYGQTMHVPFRPGEEVVILTLGTGSLVLSDDTNPVAGGEVLGGRVVLPVIDNTGAFYSELVDFADAQGWSFTYESSPTHGARIRDLQFRLPEMGALVDDVAPLLSVPTIVAEVDGTPQTFSLAESDLSHVYINENVSTVLPVAPGGFPTVLTEWLLTAVYRVNLDGSTHSDNDPKPALVVRQSFAFAAPIDDANPAACNRRAQAYPRVSVSVSIPPDAVSPPAVGRIRVDHRLAFAPEASDASLPAGEYAGAFTRDRDDVRWLLPTCLPVPLAFNVFLDRSLAHIPFELPSTTTAPVTVESLAWSPQHDAFLLHHRHPETTPLWSGFVPEPVVEAPGGSRAGVQLRWRWGTLNGPDFGDGAALMPPDQDWVFGIVDTTFPEEPATDFQTELEAKLGGVGGDDVTTAEKALFVGTWQLGTQPNRQYETLSPGFSFDVEPVAASCEVEDFVEAFGGHAALTLSAIGPASSALLLAMRAVGEVVHTCGETPPTFALSEMCDGLVIPGSELLSTTPLSLAAGATTVDFSSAGTFAVGPGMWSITRGFLLAQPEGMPGPSLDIDFTPAVRTVRALPLIVNDTTGPATLTVELFSGAASVGVVPVIATVGPDAAFAEALVSLDVGVPFDRINVVSDDPGKELGVGGFRVCSSAIAAGDLNEDGIVDAGDADVLAACAAGAGVPVALDCRAADLDFDGDVDCDDLTILDGLAGGLGVLPDGDGDGVPDACDNCPGTGNAAQTDCDGDGVGDACAIADGIVMDCNGNGVPDACDIATGTSSDVDADGIPDECEPDCNTNGVPDDWDIVMGTSEDCLGGLVPGRGNGVPDECEPDCNGNGVPDSCDILEGVIADCNANGTPDDCDIALGTSADCNANGVPDECELPWHDCNQNGVLDECDIASGTSLDCNGNGYPDDCEPDCDGDGALDVCDLDCNGNLVPDSCDLLAGTSPDCNANAVPDECDIASGTSLDCNANGVPDECDLASGASLDCNRNSVPDECDIASGFSLDCNGNGVPDECDLASGTSLDCNSNGVPDECDIASGTSADCNADGIPDECQPLIIVYVDEAATGTDGGSSWRNAFHDLNDAFAVAAQCGTQPVEIWVAAGTYAPTTQTVPGLPDSATFQLRSNLEVYGGFAGGETSTSQADPVANPTILDGLNPFLGNAWHVVMAVSTDTSALLDGFSIRNGRADDFAATTGNRGGGLYVQDANPIVRRCVFEDNFGKEGGAVHVRGASAPTFELCQFTNNSTSTRGGAIEHVADGTLTVSDAQFTGNSATTGGGALAATGAGGFAFTSCSFDANQSGVAGAALYFDSATDSGLDACDFTGHSVSGQGAAIYSVSAASLAMTGGSIVSSSSGQDGAAIYNMNGGLVLDGVTIDTATSGQRGGGIYNENSALTVSGCQFTSCNGPQGGGAIMSSSGSTAVVTQSTFTLGSSTIGGGGAIYNTGGSQLSVTGCSFTDNTTQGDGGAIVNVLGSGLQMSDCSFTDNTAVMNGGAVYCVGGTAMVWESSDFQGNIASTQRGGGLYVEAASPSVLGCTFTGNSGQGGGGASFTSDSDATIMSCSFTSNSAFAQNGGGLSADAGSDVEVLECSFSSNTVSNSGGGGIYLSACIAQVASCSFDANSAVLFGGGIYNLAGADTVITACTFTNNSGPGQGGAMCNSSSNPFVADCTFESNHTNAGGGGMRNLLASSPTVLRCRFEQNSGQNGSCVYNTDASMPSFELCTFSQNSGPAILNKFASAPSFQTCVLSRNGTAAQGGAMYTDATSSPELVGCVVSGSFAGQAGGLYCETGSITITSCILYWNNTGADQNQNAQILIGDGTQPTINYSCVQGLDGSLGGVGNIGEDPRFLNQITQDYHLRPSSPCIDSGDPGYAGAPGEVDIDGEVRVGSGAIEMGADEFYDCNANGVADSKDIADGTSVDCDGNAVPDECEALGDCNANGVPDFCELLAGTSFDCNGNGILDECDISSGTSLDCTGNGIPDECEPDCNGNGVADSCDIQNGDEQDCNGNGVPDSCEIASGASPDCNGNGIPDECENDCNGNCVPDDMDISGGLSQDCNGNGLPDECEPDCDGDGIPDDCEIDCNANGVPDECEIDLGAAPDCNGNGIPDDCEFDDCNGNCVPDDMDISAGTSADCNGNGVPDECDVASGASADVNGNGVPDECEPEIVYVDQTATGGNTGFNWTDAFVDLQDGLEAAANGAGLVTQVWVAAGTYAPSEELNPGLVRSATFRPIEGVTVYGGFDGTETMLSQRDVVANPTILTGDPAGVNAYHVVTGSYVDSTAVMDGFTIRDGNSNSAATGEDKGGGVTIAFGSPVFRNCTITQNFAIKGSGVFLADSSSPTFESCTIVDHGAILAGAGVYLSSGGSVTFTDSLLQDNSVAGNPGGAVYCEPDSGITATGTSFLDNGASLGGGIYALGTVIDLADCVFDNDSANGTGANQGLGGAIYSSGTTTVTGLHVRFANCRGAKSGGAIYALDSSVLDLSNAEFEANVATLLEGGAIFHDGSIQSTIRDSTFFDNTATTLGGAICNSSSDPDLVDCTFEANAASAGGGAVANTLGSDPALLRCRFEQHQGQNGTCVLNTDASAPSFELCTFRQNGGPAVRNQSASAPIFQTCVFSLNGSAVQGGSMFTDATSTPELVGCVVSGSTAGQGGGLYCATGSITITSCILYWNHVGNNQDQSAQIRIGDGTQPTINYSCVQGLDGSLGGVGNTGEDPRFQNQVTEDYHLRPMSPCIDAGDPGYSGAPGKVDIDGEVRVGNGVIEMGADERYDCNANGVADSKDIADGTSLDCDGNAVPDECEVLDDCNANGISDACELTSGTGSDCNGNGILDECDISSGTSLDCTGNGIPDECEPDCNGNGMADSCDIQNGDEQDCNGNGIPDACEIASGVSPDCNGNGIPDECENDCNGNCVPDDMDISGGLSQDCNGNGLPDECEPDCDGDGIPDDCEIDCNANGVPDECEIDLGAAPDCNGNGIPDDCEFDDCNGNCVPDDVDISAGTSADCNGNGVPDECDVASGASADVNGNGVPDECEPEIVYVDQTATGANTGFDWTDAFVDLQDGLEAAANGAGLVTQVWVAAGSYAPSEELNPGLARSATFRPIEGVTVYGGFDGTETMLSQRDVVANPTILTGDPAGVNAYHVVTGNFVDSTAVMDGFTIRDGVANNSVGSDDDVGAGVTIAFGSPVFRGCTITQNSAARGSGVFVRGTSSPTFEGCTVVNHGATVGGAGVYVSSGSSVTIVDSLLQNNTVGGNRGGAIYCEPDTAVTASGTSFLDNSAGLGGGIYALGTLIDLQDCVFDNDRANGSGGNQGFGGGIYSAGATVVTARHVRFANCRGSKSGGGIYTLDSSVLDLCSMEFDSNQAATLQGGGIYHGGSTQSVIRGAMFVNNSCSTGGGAIYDEAAVSLELYGTTIADNRADTVGGGLYSAGGDPVVNTCVLWDNRFIGGTNDEMAQIFALAGNPIVDYCAIDQLTGALGGTGNIGSDPLFIDAAGDDYHLTTASPCIDAGDPGFDDTTCGLDFDDEPRIGGVRVDIGVDEVYDCNNNGQPDHVDIASGTSADVDGDHVPDECVPMCEGDAAGNYCPQTVLFTTGASTISSLDGLEPSLSAGTLTLTANNLPSQPGIFIAAATQSSPLAGLPAIFNNLCIGPAGVLRLGAGADFPAGGVTTQTYNYSAMVFTAGGLIPFPALVGESWSFQRWNRDPANPAVGCTGGFCVAGFSDAITLCMAP